MFGSRVQDEVEMQRRTNNRIFPDERQNHSKSLYQVARADRFGANRTDVKNPEKLKGFSEGNIPWHRRILEPGGSIVLTWNRVFLVSCLFALFIDPFFYYVPLVRHDEADNSACVAKDQRLSIWITVLRSLADLFYMLNIAIKFHTAYVDPKSRVLGKGELVVDIKKIQQRYMRTDFAIDLLAAVPLPQVTLWLIMPAIRSSDYNIRNTTFALIIVIQYVIRMYLIVPLSNQIIKAAGVVAKSAWGGAAYNLLLYMLASHITGAIYYLLSVERQITCWDQRCLAEAEAKNTSCKYGFISCENTGSSDYDAWKNKTGKGAVSTSFLEKFFFCLWWGLLQLSSSGNPLVTSAFIVENAFAIAIGALSLILFAQLIGKMQTYLQSISKRLEEWRLRQRDMDEWMRHHQLPTHLQERVRRFVQVKWLATRGVEEESILQALPADIRRDVQRHLCLDLVRRVPFFSEMDDQLLDAICERLVSFLCPENTYISREGDPVNEMLFIIRGKLESSTTNGGRSNFFNSIILRPGDFAGEELLTWALLPKTNVHFPLSTRTVRSLTEVEAFALRAEDLKFVANQFRRLHSKKLQHTFRFYSHHWRTWAACFIQAAWRQHQRRKLAESLSRLESYSWWSEDHPAADKPKPESSSSSTPRIVAEGAIAHMHKLASASRRFTGSLDISGEFRPVRSASRFMSQKLLHYLLFSGLASGLCLLPSSVLLTSPIRRASIPNLPSSSVYPLAITALHYQSSSGMRAGRPKIGDRATSDVVVRLRTPEGRDEWLYCHSAVLAAGSTYFADRLSDSWPTCQILGSRYSVEVYCQEADLSPHVNALRLLYAAEPCSLFGVRGALGILQAAVHLGCSQIAAACTGYLESAPWDEADEEEILRIVPGLGPQYECILARLRPIDPAPVTSIFLSAFRHATLSSGAGPARELKAAAQEQLEYMLTEDDDAPLLALDNDTVKSQVKDCVSGLLSKFSDFMNSIISNRKEPPFGGDDGELQQELHSLLCDISWVCQVLNKLEMMKLIVPYWIGVSSDVVEAVEAVSAGFDCLKTRLKVVEVSARVLEALAFGNIVLAAEKRSHAVNVWIGFAGRTKSLVDQADCDDGGSTDTQKENLDSEIWLGLESAIVSIVLTLPSNSQAEILSQWLQSKHVKYPDLTEAFEAWCYRSKVAKRRLSFLSQIDQVS
ncbi:hypothetical protein EJB05_43957 [Eragrostis curvula]|uniref:Cyclic nucleotide-binding domain-containing protein n=1 Tax=Eragrostis curvula TaxID=38414 RepID=A0A5J9TGF6_9POAL|nr:hypothetical protein EJB05_43957 [Eragrostis curvula]